MIAECTFEIALCHWIWIRCRNPRTPFQCTPATIPSQDQRVPVGETAEYYQLNSGSYPRLNHYLLKNRVSTLRKETEERSGAPGYMSVTTDRNHSQFCSPGMRFIFGTSGPIRGPLSFKSHRFLIPSTFFVCIQPVCISPRMDMPLVEHAALD